MTVPVGDTGITSAIEVVFSIKGQPPKKDGAKSMWGKLLGLARLRALRLAAYVALNGRSLLGGTVELTLRVRAATRAGDLDNFITGVFDGLMAADTRSKIDPNAWVDLSEAVRPDHPIAYADDACIGRIFAERLPQGTDGPSYDVELRG